MNAIIREMDKAALKARTRLAARFLLLILADGSPEESYIKAARSALADGMSAACVEQCFADAACSAFPEPRVAERLCQIFVEAMRARTGL